MCISNGYSVFEMDAVYSRGDVSKLDHPADQESARVSREFVPRRSASHGAHCSGACFEGGPSWKYSTINHHEEIEKRSFICLPR